MAPRLARTDKSAPDRGAGRGGRARIRSRRGADSGRDDLAAGAEFRKKLKELRDHLTANADNVGKKFPEEARKMHYGETEHRSIYGEASPQDAKELHEEGIEFHPLPVLPDERNSCRQRRGHFPLPLAGEGGEQRSCEPGEAPC